MKKIFFIICLFNLSFSLKSQSSLGIDTNPGSYYVPATACFNDGKLLMVTIKNYGAQACTGQIDLVIGIDSSANGSSLTAILMVDSFSVNIPVNGSLSDTTTVLIDPSFFRSGINTVVIWPRMASSGPTVTTHDSLHINILVNCYADINNPASVPKTLVYPNPAHDRLWIINKNKNFTIEQVRIFDQLGQLIHADFFSDSLELNSFSPGIYFVEFISREGKIIRYKINKE